MAAKERQRGREDVEGVEAGNGYAQFESILNKLHTLGFYPEISLISAVAKAM